MNLFSKTKTQKKDPLADSINQTGKTGLETFNRAAKDLNDQFYANPENFAQNQVDLENNAIRSAAKDAERRTQQLMSQRGMSNSSIGLGQQVNQRQSLNEKLALNNASTLGRTKNLLNEKLQLGQNQYGIKAAQGPIRMEDVKYKTGGGGLALLGAGLGTAAGAYFGGPAGAAAGAQLGSGLGKMFDN